MPPSAVENTLFLFLFCGLPILVGPFVLYRLVRALLTPSPLTVLARAATERGWREAREPRAHVMRFEGEVDGIPFVLQQRRKLRRTGQRKRHPVEVTMPLDAGPGLFVVQPVPPAALSGRGDALVREGLAELFAIALDERRGALLGALRRLPTAPDGELGAWSTEAEHALAPHAAALIAHVAGHPDRGRLVLDVLDGTLTVRIREPSVPYADLVPFAAECRRILGSRQA
jgi:hypothetical protein